MGSLIEEVRRLTGDGQLRDDAGRTVPVVYVLRVRREVGVELRSDGRIERSQGKHDALGVMARSVEGGEINLHGRLELTLADGCTVQVQPAGIRDPRAPIPFMVPDVARLLPPEQLSSG